ncbi:MAG: tyrosine--tRNA ligase, partial [Clostridia bacterium]|nr:tyrosine--tRNA ligase [Clostridia bacterium]
IREMSNWEGAELNKAKEILAYELTNMVHGKEEADKALEAARAVFAGGGSSENMPTTEVDAVDTSVVDLLIAGKLAPSKGEAKRLIQQGGICVDDVKIERFDAIVEAKKLSEGVIVKKGKKVFHKFIAR